MASIRVDPVTAAKLKYKGVEDDLNVQFDSAIAHLDYAKAQREADDMMRRAAIEHRYSLLDRGRALRSGAEERQAKLEVAAQKAAEKEAKAKEAGKPPPPTENLDDLYQPVEPNAQSPDPAQLPISSIGAGGPQGVQMGKAREYAQSMGFDVPDFTVAGNQQSTTATRNFGAGIYMPDTTVQSNIGIRQNALSPGDALRSTTFLLAAREKLRQAEVEKQLDRVAEIGAAAEVDPRMGILYDALTANVDPGTRADLDRRVLAKRGVGLTTGPRETAMGEGGKPESVPRNLMPVGAELWRRGPDQTRVSVSNVVMPDVPTPSTQTALQARATAGVRSIDTLSEISRTFDPTFLTYRGKIKGKIGDIMSKAEADLSPEERDFRTRFARFRAATGVNLADTIRATTGAQMSDREWERYQKFMPNEDMSIEQFVGAWQEAMTLAMLAVARANYLAQGGFGDKNIEGVIGTVPDDVLYDKTVPLDSVRSLIREHQGTLEEQIRLRSPGLSDAEVKRAASRQTLKAFGVEKFYDQRVLTPGQR